MRRRKPDRPFRPGRFAYEGLERLLHERARLGIMASLANHPDGLVFSELKRLCALTDGNLSRHIEILRDAGLIEVWKGVDNRRPLTICRVSSEGRHRFLGYLEELAQVIRDSMPSASRRFDRPPDLPAGFQPI